MACLIPEPHNGIKHRLDSGDEVFVKGLVVGLGMAKGMGNVKEHFLKDLREAKGSEEGKLEEEPLGWLGKVPCAKAKGGGFDPEVGLALSLNLLKSSSLQR